MKNKAFDAIRRFHKSCKTYKMRIYDSKVNILNDTSLMMECVYPRVGNLVLLLESPVVSMQDAAVEHYLASLPPEDALEVETYQVFTPNVPALEKVHIYSALTSCSSSLSTVRSVSGKRVPFNIQKMLKSLSTFESMEQVEKVFERPATYVMENNLQNSLPLPQFKVAVNCGPQIISIVVTLATKLTEEDAMELMLAALGTYVADKDWGAFVARYRNLGEAVSWDSQYQAELQYN